MIGTLAARAWSIASRVGGHHPVVGRDHDDRDVGHPGAPGAHRGERLVAGRVEEDDSATVLGHLAGADVLGDATPLAGGDTRRPEGIEEARLAVVDVAHDRDDRGARLEQGGIVLLVEDLLRRLGDRLLAGHHLARSTAGNDRLGDLEAELAGDERRGVAVDQLVDRGEDSALDQLADHVRGVDVEELGQLLDRDRRRQLDRATLARLEHLHAALARAGIAARGLARTAATAGPAPTPCHDRLLRPSRSVGPAPGRRGSSGLPDPRPGSAGTGPERGSPLPGPARDSCRWRTRRHLGPPSCRWDPRGSGRPAPGRSGPAPAWAASLGRRHRSWPGRVEADGSGSGPRRGLRRHLPGGLLRSGFGRSLDGDGRLRACRRGRFGGGLPCPWLGRSLADGLGRSLADGLGRSLGR